MSRTALSNCIKDKIDAFYQKIQVISVPTGRELSCCDAANFFESYVRITVRQLQHAIDREIATSPNASLLLPIRSGVDEINRVSSRVFTNFSRNCCDSSCCVEAARAIAIVSNSFLLNLATLTGNVSAGIVDATVENSALSSLLVRFNKIIKFVVATGCCGEPFSKKSVTNIILNPMETTLAPPMIPPANVANIVTCCQAVVASIGEAYENMTLSQLIFIGDDNFIIARLQAIDTLNDIFLNSLKHLLCCDRNCCRGTAEGLLNLFIASVTALPVNPIIPVTLTNEQIESEFQQDANALLRNAC